MERGVGEVVTADDLELGQPVQHPEIDVVRVRLRDVGVSRLEVGQIGRKRGDLERDRLALAGGVFECDCLSHWPRSLQRDDRIGLARFRGPTMCFRP